jgi:hypothetical protein
MGATPTIKPPQADAETTGTVFLRNMAALWHADARLAQAIDDLPPEQRIEVCASRAGPPTAVHQHQGRPIYLHSRYDPRAEAESFADSVKLEGKFCLVVSGFALAYHLLALRRRLPTSAAIVVTEPDLVLIKTALEHVDCAELIRPGRFAVLTDTNAAHVQEKLQPMQAMMMLGAQFVGHPASERVAGKFHRQLRKQITDFAAYVKTSLVTLVANAQITATNVANNLPTYVASPPIDLLENRFAGYPAVIIAAGPSLRRNVDQLHDAGGRAVLIAVQTVFKQLLARGIRPHFVTSLDYHEVSRRFFEGIDDFARVHLVAEPKATWHVIDAFRGPVSLLGNEFAQRCLGAEHAVRAGLKSGATVAHLAFYLAEYLGCNPIILVGQDLAFSDGLYYAPGAAIHQQWQPELGRFTTLEMKEWERVVRHRAILRPITDVHGRPAYTDEQMFTYLQQFEVDFAATRARVIDASEGGVVKRHTEIMPLAEALQHYATRPLPVDALRYRDETTWFHASALALARQEVEGRLKELDGLRAVCTETLALLEEMTSLVSHPREFNRRMIRVDELRTKVAGQQRIFRLVGEVSQLAEFRKFTADRHIDAEQSTGPERARAQLARDREFVQALLEGCDRLEPILRGSLERFDQAIIRSSPGSWCSAASSRGGMIGTGLASRRCGTARRRSTKTTSETQ